MNPHDDRNVIIQVGEAILGCIGLAILGLWSLIRGK